MILQHWLSVEMYCYCMISLVALSSCTHLNINTILLKFWIYQICRDNKKGIPVLKLQQRSTALNNVVSSSHKMCFFLPENRELDLQCMSRSCSYSMNANPRGLLLFLSRIKLIWKKKTQPTLKLIQK